MSLSRFPRHLLLRASRAAQGQPAIICSQCQRSRGQLRAHAQRRYESTTTTPAAGAAPPAPPPPPLLLKIRGDLKAAMKARDGPRLDALRGLLADVTNASKTRAPVRTDVQLLALLRRRAAQSAAAAGEFAGAGREDLRAREQAQADVLEAYAAGVQVVPEAEVGRAAREARDAMAAAGVKVDVGSLLRRLVGPGGALEDRPVDRATVAQVVKSMLAAPGAS